MLKVDGILIIAVPTLFREMQRNISMWKPRLLIKGRHFQRAEIMINKWTPWAWNKLVRDSGFLVVDEVGHQLSPIRRQFFGASLLYLFEHIVERKFPWKYLGLGFIMKCKKNTKFKDYENLPVIPSRRNLFDFYKREGAKGHHQKVLYSNIKHRALMKKVQELLIDNLSANSMALDVGCAEGFYTAWLSRFVKFTVGIDLPCQVEACFE